MQWVVEVLYLGKFRISVAQTSISALQQKSRRDESLIALRSTMYICIKFYIFYCDNCIVLMSVVATVHCDPGRTAGVDSVEGPPVDECLNQKWHIGIVHCSNGTTVG